MLPILIAEAFTLILATSVVARPYDTIIPTLITRHAQDSLSEECKAPCATFTALKDACDAPQCRCTDQYVQAQGECLLCNTDTAPEAASVQFALDVEIILCREYGIPIHFEHLDLPPDAQAIVDEFYRRNAHLNEQQTAFLALQIVGGHIGLVVVLAFAVFSRTIFRDPTFLNFCITSIFSSVVYSIFLYHRTEGNTIFHPLGISVPRNTCLAQAAFVNGAQVMTACSTMALVIQLWIGLRTAIHGDPSWHGRKWQRRCATVALLVLPYIFFVAFSVPSVVVSVRRSDSTWSGVKHNLRVGKMGGGVTIQDTMIHWQRVVPTNFYCSIIQLKPFLQAIYGVTLGLLIITGVFDACIINILWRNWWAFRHVQAKSAVSLSLLLRVVVFSIYRVVVAVAYGSILVSPPPVIVLQDSAGQVHATSFSVPVWVDMLQASIPFVAFLVLGLNGDMLVFWRRPDKRPASSIHIMKTDYFEGSMI